MDYAAERARLLFGCYRRADANDPDTYVAAVAAILAEYDMGVIKTVTDPRTGIARISKWMPTISELDEACIREREKAKHTEYMRMRGFEWENGRWEKKNKGAMTSQETRADLRALASDPPEPKVRRPKIIEIKRAVAEHFAIEPIEIDGGRRGMHIVRVRHIAMHLCKTLTEHSLAEIGRRFGGRDHTSVMHAVESIEKKIAAGSPSAVKLYDEIEDIKAAIIAKVQNGQAKQT